MIYFLIFLISFLALTLFITEVVIIKKRGTLNEHKRNIGFSIFSGILGGLTLSAISSNFFLGMTEVSVVAYFTLLILRSLERK
ncbi:MAG: hypothetical protein NTZ36_02690 [Candidatus Jorgensenbacteria bacterium]|nr:hypothetical protein [Candidatus Jorgensenbacteria bacterium]